MTGTPVVRGSDREFAFTATDFERVRKLIYRHAGISLAPGKQEMVYSRLARRLRARKLRRFADYLALLESGDTPEWELFVNSLTTNLTAFFRENHHFPLLAEFASSRCQSGRMPFRVWCCAASTGEEPYSIAMTLVEALGTAAASRASVLASDLDTAVLARGEAGFYDAERVSKLTSEQLRRFFTAGAAGGMLRVSDELRAMVSFRKLNLLDPSWPLRGPFDAIFCRNVMIYFDRPTQRRILERLVPLLHDDGLLFAGHSESFFHAADLFRLRGNTVYGRVPASSAG
ncbi:MAG: chemotaxis protein CheR [Burkholderiales bacterium]|nr:chemotaxis protein CheR [Burkholderiales bacterium]